MAKVTIIVPVYNVENYLKRCVISILKQTLNDIEVILVDDGSTDTSGKICDELKLSDKRIKVIHKKNGGLSSARNVGIKFATSELIGFVDSDDWISEDMYEYLYHIQQKNNADIVSCCYVLTNSDSTEIKNKKVNESIFNRDEALLHYIQLGLFSSINDYSACKKIYKRTLFEKVLFPEGFLFEDMVTNFEMIQHCNIYVYSTKECYYYFQNSTSITRNQYSKKHNDLIAISEKMIKLAENESDEIKKYTQLQLVKAYFSLLVKIVRYGHNDDVSEEYIENELLKKFRKNFFTFMKARFSITRKCVALIICINWKFAKKIFFKKS